MTPMTSDLQSTPVDKVTLLKYQHDDLHSFMRLTPSLTAILGWLARSLQRFGEEGTRAGLHH